MADTEPVNMYWVEGLKDEVWIPCYGPATLMLARATRNRLIDVEPTDKGYEPWMRAIEDWRISEPEVHKVPKATVHRPMVTSDASAKVQQPKLKHAAKASEQIVVRVKRKKVRK